MTCYLLKMSELWLKKGNRGRYEKRLCDNLRLGLAGTGARLYLKQDRLYIEVDDSHSHQVEALLETTSGLASWARAFVGEKNLEKLLSLCQAASAELVTQGIRRFKIEARRSDKSFPLNSYAIMREAGAAVLKAQPNLIVDVQNPERIIEVEIRERAYVYANEQPGLRGLPAGSSGRGLLLLSGGIDSPVAGFLLARRGLQLQGLHFQAYPYTSDQALEKVQALAAVIARYSLGLRLTTVNFTDCLVHIKRSGPEGWSTVLTRMAMMAVADRLAKTTGASCLITGDSLGQVASQTPENLACAELTSSLPVLRPLIGMDKIDIIDLARKIGSYTISIQPFVDCCSIFSPTHPVLKAKTGLAWQHFQALEIEELLNRAYQSAQTVDIGFPDPSFQA